MTRKQAINKREKLAGQFSSPIGVLRGSLLQRTGRIDVSNVVGGWAAWTAMELPVVAA